MCGRFTYLFTWAEIHDRLQAFIDAFDRIGEGVIDQPPRYNIAPTQPIVVLFHPLDGEPGSEARLMRWGLVPTWVKDPRDFPLVFNARAETLGEKPAFRGSLSHHRCLVPASGYYEWQKRPDGGKQPYYITLPGGGPMWFAGIYSTWLGADGGEIDTVAIVTVAANAEMRPIHDRMPALIADEKVKDWLDFHAIGGKDARALLKPAAPGVLVARRVSTRVNSARIDAPDLIEPASA